MKAYYGVDGKIRLFRPMENMKRLKASAKVASLPVSGSHYNTPYMNNKRPKFLYMYTVSELHHPERYLETMSSMHIIIASWYCIIQDFDEIEFLECIKDLIRVDRDWVPKTDNCSLYLRPTFIATDVRVYVYVRSQHIVCDDLYLIACTHNDPIPHHSSMIVSVCVCVCGGGGGGWGVGVSVLFFIFVFM